MNKRDVHRLIEEQDPEAKENLRKTTEDKLGFSLSQQPEAKKQTRNIGKFCAIFAPAVCVICLLIALPFLVKNDSQGNSAGNSAPQDPNRYCTQSDYTLLRTDRTLKEYSQNNGNDILYLDWYERAAEIETRIHVSVNDETDIIFFHETIYLEDTYDEIDLYITDGRTTVDILESIETRCINGLTVNGVSVSWVYINKVGSVMFAYKGHRYFIVVPYPIEEQDVTEMVSGML